MLKHPDSRVSRAESWASFLQEKIISHFLAVLEIVILLMGWQQGKATELDSKNNKQFDPGERWGDWYFCRGDDALIYLFFLVGLLFSVFGFLLFNDTSYQV